MFVLNMCEIGGLMSVRGDESSLPKSVWSADYVPPQPPVRMGTKAILAGAKSELASIRSAISADSPADSASIDDLGKKVKDLTTKKGEVSEQLKLLKGGKEWRASNKEWYKRSISTSRSINKTIKELEIFEAEVGAKLTENRKGLRKLECNAKKLAIAEKNLPRVFRIFSSGGGGDPISYVLADYLRLKRDCGNSSDFKKLCIDLLEGEEGYDKFLAQAHVVKRLTDDTKNNRIEVLYIDEAMAFVDLSPNQQIACLQNGMLKNQGGGRVGDHLAAYNLLSGVRAALQYGTEEQKKKMAERFATLEVSLLHGDINCNADNIQWLDLVSDEISQEKNPIKQQLHYIRKEVEPILAQLRKDKEDAMYQADLDKIRGWKED
jgi:hypothetical protein